MDADRIVSSAARRPFEQSLRAGRLARLARMGLAEDIGRGAWRLADGLEETLRRMGERGDIIRTMQRAFAGRGDAPAPRSEEHTSELQSLMRLSYAVFCLKKKNKKHH